MRSLETRRPIAATYPRPLCAYLSSTRDDSVVIESNLKMVRSNFRKQLHSSNGRQNKWCTREHGIREKRPSFSPSLPRHFIRFSRCGTIHQSLVVFSGTSSVCFHCQFWNWNALDGRPAGYTVFLVEIAKFSRLCPLSRNFPFPLSPRIRISRERQTDRERVRANRKNRASKLCLNYD